jgi:PD-(D/E)XK nuclease superfamily
MRSENPQADNLFSRLISYTPREDRTALEDFCTESLAWCLRCSPEFRRDFLKLVRVNLIKKQALFMADTDDMTVNIETQFAFSESEVRGRFDLMLSDLQTGFILVVEVKVDSDLTDKQIDGYLKHLNGKRHFLISLTKQPIQNGLEKKLDAVLRWSGIQRLLEQQTSTQHVLMLQQFGGFLKEQGMYPMKIIRIAPERLADWKDSFALQRDLWEILDTLSKAIEIKPFFLLDKKEKQKKILFEFSRDKRKLWLGIYGNSKPLDWIGFEILEFSSSPTLLMIISLHFDGIIPKEKLLELFGPTLKETTQKYGCNSDPDKFGCDYDPIEKQNATWLNFRQPIDDNYNGDADKIYNWLLSAIKDSAKLRF